MSEFYKFDYGHCDPPNWSMLKKSDIEYYDFEPSIDWPAEGGQRVPWQYSRGVPNKDSDKTSFGFDEWFRLIEPAVLFVSASITKLGIALAPLSTFYRILPARHGDGDRSQG